MIEFNFFKSIAAFSLILSLGQNASAAVEFDYSQVIQILNESQPKTVEEFLAALPKSVRANFVLMHHSQSDLQTSFKQPRVLLSNKDATLLMAFSGNPDVPRGNVVEFIRFDAANKIFMPSEIDFSKSDEELGRPRVNENPQACTGCHGGSREKFHPNWRSYDRWPGAFGDFHAGGFPARPTDQMVYLRFRAGMLGAGQTRYSLLERVPFNVGTLGARNSVLTSLIGSNNVERVAGLIATALREKPELYPAVFSMLAIKPLKTYSTHFVWFLEKLYPGQRLTDRYHELVAKETAAVKADKKAKKDLFRSFILPPLLPPAASEFNVAPIAAMSTILKELGVDLQFETWATIFKNGANEFATPSGSFFNDVALNLYDSGRAPADLLSTLRAANLNDIADLLESKTSYSIRPIGKLRTVFSKSAQPRRRVSTCESIFR